MIPDDSGEIAKRAYHIWEGEGRPSGKDLDHWLRAEAEMQAEDTEAPVSRPTNGRRVETIAVAHASSAKRPTPRRTPRRKTP